MSQKAIDVVAALAKIYNLSTGIRATDHLRHLDADLPSHFRLVQSILEHSAMTARVVEFICLVYGDDFRNARLDVNPEHASFLAAHHDDPEWWTGDMVPVLGYRGFTQEDKRLAEKRAIDLLLGTGDNFLRRAHEEYEARQTPDAKLAKTSDLLELFCHNRILAAYDLGIITWDNYKQTSPETWQESAQFLRLRDASGDPTPLTIAEILESAYIDRFATFGFPPILVDIFADLTDAIRTFPFRDIVRIDEP